jgi:hypothetical protein
MLEEIQKLIECQNFLEEALEFLMMAEFWYSATKAQKRYLFELIESAKMSIELAFEELKKENMKGFWYWLKLAEGRIEEGEKFARYIINKIDKKFWKLLKRARENLIELSKALKRSEGQNNAVL